MWRALSVCCKGQEAAPCGRKCHTWLTTRQQVIVKSVRYLGGMDSSETSSSSPLPVAVATTPTMSLTQSQTGYADTIRHEVETRLQNAASLEERKRTYGGRWPREGPFSLEKLAQAGFKYVGPGLAVQCVLCGLKIDKWLLGDSPLGAHLASKPQCLFVADVYHSNRAIDEAMVEPFSDRNANRASSAPLTEYEALAAENAQLKAARQCRVCRENEIVALFVPCGHLATCDKCAAYVDQCPICDSIVKASVVTFR